MFCEEFRQWVIEDKFPAGRPALETVGATFVADVAPYELMKIRILNGGHAAIAYPAGAARHPLRPRGDGGQADRDLPRDADQARDPVGRAAAAGVTLEAYRQKVAERFANPKIGDTITRLCLDGSNRQPKFILPSVVDRLKAGQSFAGLALVSALWCRYCYGELESGKIIPPNDPNWDRLQQAARPARADPRAFLAMRDIFGELSDTPAYVAAFSNALTKLWSQGVRATLDAYLAGRL